MKGRKQSHPPKDKSHSRAQLLPGTDSGGVGRAVLPGP